MKNSSSAKLQPNIFFFIPNIIGYFRLLLIVVCSLISHRPWPFILLYLLSITLDFFDGYAARRLNQASDFGAWLDVVVDNIGRAMIWSVCCPSLSWIVTSLEWMAFLAASSPTTTNNHWKSRSTADPALIRAIMHNGFLNPLGALVIGGVHGLPLWLYCVRQGGGVFASVVIDSAILCLLASGRVVGVLAELWFIVSHADRLAARQHAQ